MQSEKIRLIVFSVFAVLLVVFGMLYEPVNGVSRPAARAHAVVTPAGKPASNTPASKIPASNMTARQMARR